MGQHPPEHHDANTTPAPSGEGRDARQRAVAGPFTARDLTVLGSVLVLFVGSILPIMFVPGVAAYGNFWNVGFTMPTIIFGALLPLLVAGLFIARRVSGQGDVLRVGSLSLDQFASVVASVATVFHLFNAISFFQVGSVIATVGALGLLVATVGARWIPVFEADFRVRPTIDAHPVARPAVPAAPVVRAERPAARRPDRTGPDADARPGAADAGPAIETSAVETLGGTIGGTSAGATAVTRGGSSSDAIASGASASSAAVAEHAEHGGRTEQPEYAERDDVEAFAESGRIAPATDASTPDTASVDEPVADAAAAEPPVIEGTVGGPADDDADTDEDAVGDPDEQDTVVHRSTGDSLMTGDVAVTDDVRNDGALDEDALDEGALDDEALVRPEQTADPAGDSPGDHERRTGPHQPIGAVVDRDFDDQHRDGQDLDDRDVDVRDSDDQDPEDRQFDDRTYTAGDIDEYVRGETVRDAATDADDAAGAVDAEAFWFAVAYPRPVVDEHSGHELFTLEPGAWILALEDRGQAFLVQHVDGRVGVLHDLDDIERA